LTKSSNRNLVLAVATLFLLTMPAVAFAGGKGGGGSGNHTSSGGKPSENISLNYGKIEHSYTQQSASKKTGTTKGKRQQYLKYEMQNVYISR
jgi:type VI protein secretion system component Hcp